MRRAALYGASCRAPGPGRGRPTSRPTDLHVIAQATYKLLITLRPGFLRNGGAREGAMPDERSSTIVGAAWARRRVRRKRAAPSESVRCRLCGRWYRAITWTHLRKAHGVYGVSEYKEEFGLRFVTCGATRKLSSEIRTRWTPETVVEVLRQRYQKKQSLAFSIVAREAPGLIHAAGKCCGGYRPAVAAAGYDYRTVSPPPERRQWTDERIIRRIRQYQREGRPLNAAAVIRYDEALYEAARRYRGSWEAALELADIDYNSVRFRRSKYTREEAVRTLRKLAHAGCLLRPRDMRRSRKYKSLYFACCRYWKSMTGAARAAGFDYTGFLEEIRSRERRWSRKGVLRALRAHYRRARPGVMPMDVYQAAKRYFRTFSGALKAAAREANPKVSARLAQALERVRARQRRWTKETVLSAIHRHFQRAHAGPVPNDLRCAARTYFRKFSRAVDASGLHNRSA